MTWDETRSKLRALLDIVAHAEMDETTLRATVVVRVEEVLSALATPGPFEQGSPLPEAVQALALAGRKLDAIRVLRNEYGIGLVLAKDAVEAFIATERLKAEARLLSTPAQVAAPPADLVALVRRVLTEYDAYDLRDEIHGLEPSLADALDALRAVPLPEVPDGR